MDRSGRNHNGTYAETPVRGSVYTYVQQPTFFEARSTSVPVNLALLPVGLRCFSNAYLKLVCVSHANHTIVSDKTF